ncbi:MAG: hypothetical protein MUE84_02765, partial [Hyphomonas sp.]|nr:hypothetical protein [Hyphomonas sp.]
MRIAIASDHAAIAMKAGYPVPDQEQVQFALSVGPEEAIVNGFRWSEDKSKVNELVESYRQELAKRKSKWQKGGVTNRNTKTDKETPKVVLKSDV